jgi:hypothetical protein
VHVGAQGPRGLAAGRFHADPELESLVLFGYDKKVVLLTRRKGGWESEVLFVDRDVKPRSAGADVASRLEQLGIATID